MINPYYFKDNDFYNYFKINLDSHHIKHLNSKNHNIVYNRI